MIIKKKERIKKSKVWTISKEELNLIVLSCSNFSELLRKLGFSFLGGYTRNSLKQRLKKDDISTSHFIVDNTGRLFDYSKTLDECLKMIFVENSTYSPNTVKRYLKKYKFVNNDKCSCCRQPDVWNGKHLTMQLDHKDGDNKNNTLPNLRFICPNCHSQTDTFSGRNMKII